MKTEAERENKTSGLLYPLNQPPDFTPEKTLRDDHLFGKVYLYVTCGCFVRTMHPVEYLKIKMDTRIPKRFQ